MSAGAFAVGESVAATVTTQGMVQGGRYRVAERQATSTPFGEFATYVLERENGERFAVRNLHMLADSSASWAVHNHEDQGGAMNLERINGLLRRGGIEEPPAGTMPLERINRLLGKGKVGA